MQLNHKTGFYLEYESQTYVIQVNYIKTRKLIIQLNYLMSCSV